MQSAVDGRIEAIYPFEEEIAIVCNDEAKLRMLEPNRVLVNSKIEKVVDIIQGDFFLCGLGEEDFADFPEELEEKYLHLMNQLSCFWISRKAMALAATYDLMAEEA